MHYKCLNKQIFQNGTFSITPIRTEDRFEIMQWRNDQIKILRQKKLLTLEEQNSYFENVVSKLFLQDRPEQILLSFFENGKLIGYGGLVHIDWESSNAEISFINETSRSLEREKFINDWREFLFLIKLLVKDELKFRKIYTYAFDLRPHLYTALLKSGFIEEARLKDHVLIGGTFNDVVIHSCFFGDLSYRKAAQIDEMLFFEWVNDQNVRENSLSSAPISLADHKNWFSNKINDRDTCLLVFILDGDFVGQVRIEKKNGHGYIDISVDSHFRGKSIGPKILKAATDYYHAKFDTVVYDAVVKKGNLPSYHTFIKNGFEIVDDSNEYTNFRLIK